MEWHMAIPGILRETSEGLQRIPVQDEMFRRREIECAGQITEESAYGISLQLRCLQAAGPGEGITLYINSPGGSVTAGLALYDVMKAVGCPVRTVCVGLAASMAALLFAAGDCRDMLPHARVMVHDPLIAGGVGGSALQVDSVSRNLMKTREVMAGLLARHTGKSISEIYEKTASDTYFDAQEAVDYGLADRIMTRRACASWLRSMTGRSCWLLSPNTNAKTPG